MYRVPREAKNYSAPAISLRPLSSSLHLPFLRFPSGIREAAGFILVEETYLR